jgi:hypothetical protein
MYIHEELAISVSNISVIFFFILRMPPIPARLCWRNYWSKKPGNAFPNREATACSLFAKEVELTGCRSCPRKKKT